MKLRATGEQCRDSQRWSSPVSVGTILIRALLAKITQHRRSHYSEKQRKKCKPWEYFVRGMGAEISGVATLARHIAKEAKSYRPVGLEDVTVKQSFSESLHVDNNNGVNRAHARQKFASIFPRSVRICWEWSLYIGSS